MTTMWDSSVYYSSTNTTSSRIDYFERRSLALTFEKDEDSIMERSASGRYHFGRKLLGIATGEGRFGFLFVQPQTIVIRLTGRAYTGISQQRLYSIVRYDAHEMHLLFC